MSKTTKELDKIARQMMKLGWEFKEDQFYPVSDARRMGWWVATYVENPDSLVPTERRGDSKPFYYATETTARLYTNIA